MSFDKREFRTVLGQFATGVCVVCTRNAQGQQIGLTVNSFSSVSLEPPLVLWSLQKDSEFYQVYANAKRYSINVLASSQQALSGYYAKKGDHLMDDEHYCCPDNCDAYMHDTLASFQCEQYAVHEAGDHLIIIGRVVDFINTETTEPLLFHGGSYESVDRRSTS